MQLFDRFFLVIIMSLSSPPGALLVLASVQFSFSSSTFVAIIDVTFTSNHLLFTCLRNFLTAWLAFRYSNSRTAIAAAIIGLLLVFFVVAIFVTTIFCHNNFKSAFYSFVHAISPELRASFSAPSGASFLFIRVINFWSHSSYLTLKNDFLTWKLTFIYFNSKR